MKRILCLSGGGVMGVAQLQVLKKLEEENGPLHKYYDLIVGTSVGAINASIIATGSISMKELDTIYDEMISRIFKRRGLFKKPIYDRNNFIDAWSDIINPDIKYGDAKTKLMTTTVDLVTDTNIFYKSWDDDDANEKMTDIICRSFAAPMYFGQIVDVNNKCVYSDGGIGNANLPINEAKIQAEAFGWYKSRSTVEIHAVGTLFSNEKHKFEDVAKANWFNQIVQFMNPMQGGLARAQSVNDQVRMMTYICKYVPSIKFKYWDTEFDHKKLKLDGVKYVKEYREAGIVMAESPIVNV